jgi:DNA-binding GntR family transcriptional regulator
MTVEDVREIFYMRSVLEGLAARLAAMSLSDAVVDRLATLVERMDNAQTHPSDWLRVHEEFHALVCKQAGMPRLQREIERLRTAVEPYLRVFLTTHGMGELKGSKHRALLTALRKRDGELAERAIRDHIERAFREIWDVINRAKEIEQPRKQARGRLEAASNL